MLGSVDGTLDTEGISLGASLMDGDSLGFVDRLGPSDGTLDTEGTSLGAPLPLVHEGLESVTPVLYDPNGKLQHVLASLNGQPVSRAPGTIVQSSSTNPTLKSYVVPTLRYAQPPE